MAVAVKKGCCLKPTNQTDKASQNSPLSHFYLFLRSQRRLQDKNELLSSTSSNLTAMLSQVIALHSSSFVFLCSKLSRLFVSTVHRSEVAINGARRRRISWKLNYGGQH